MFVEHMQQRAVFISPTRDTNWYHWSGTPQSRGVETWQLSKN